MTGRRKDVPCGLCGEPTRDDAGICRGCRKAYAAGNDWLAVQEAKAEAEHGGPFEFRLDVYSLVGHWTDPREERPSEHDLASLSTSDASKELVKAIQGLILAIGGVQIERQMMWDEPSVKAGARGGGYSSAYWVSYTCPAQIGPALQALFDAMQLHGAACYWNGRRDGEGFLTDAASGGMALNELQRRMLETEQRRIIRR